MYQQTHEKEINFTKYGDNHAIHLTFSPQPNEEQLTMNLKTEEFSVPNVHSFLTDHSNIFDQKIGYYTGKILPQDQYDYYIISKSELLKLISQKPPQGYQYSQQRQIQTVKNQSIDNKENKGQQQYTSVQKLNQPLPSRQRSQTHLHSYQKKY